APLRTQRARAEDKPDTQDEPKALKRAPGTAADTAEPDIAKFIDDKTVAVVRFDLDRIDVKAIQEWVQQGLGKAQLPPELLQMASKELPAQFDKAQKWLDSIKKAGGHKVYVVLTLTDLIDNERPPF